MQYILTVKSDELLKIVNEKEAQKQLLTEDRKRDAEFTRKLKEDYDREVESKKQAKLYEQRTLADSYQQHNQRLSQEQILKVLKHSGMSDTNLCFVFRKKMNVGLRSK